MFEIEISIFFKAIKNRKITDFARPLVNGAFDSATSNLGKLSPSSPAPPACKRFLRETPSQVRLTVPKRLSMRKFREGESG